MQDLKRGLDLLGLNLLAKSHFVVKVDLFTKFCWSLAGGEPEFNRVDLQPRWPKADKLFNKSHVVDHFDMD